MLIYDLETFPNIFTATYLDIVVGEMKVIEISTRINETNKLIDWLSTVYTDNKTMVGFNNLGFDYPIIHYIMNNYDNLTVEDIYSVAQRLINTHWNLRHTNIVRKPLIKQLDLMKVHHFDNAARLTSLKMLEINMQMSNVEDLPFKPGTVLTDAQMDTLIEYNKHDVLSTFNFYKESKEQIQLRYDLSEIYGVDMLNHSDSKIGSQIFIKSLEEEGVRCFGYTNGQRQAIQTIRKDVSLVDCILPYINFENYEFKGILKIFENKIISDTKGVFKDLKCIVNNVEYIFGVGGLHASVSNKSILTTNKRSIVDVDVKSYYPNLAIKNQIYPAHLSEQFCYIYEKLYLERNKCPKSSALNAALKIALNGTYGNSGNKYSPFYDIKYLLTITISGQLSLLMLVDMLLKIPTLEIVQCNTDGITYSVDNEFIDLCQQECKKWENITNLELETVNYSRFWVRDVNNYIAEYDGGLKRKGAFCYGDEIGWHQNHSMQVVAKALTAYFVRGQSVQSFIESHATLYDFMIALKVPKTSRLMWSGVHFPSTLRYVVSDDGSQLTKIMPAKGKVGDYKRANSLDNDYYDFIKEQVGSKWDERINTKNKSKYEDRTISINAGYDIIPCMHIDDLEGADINYQFYIDQANKIIDKFN